MTSTVPALGRVLIVAENADDLAALRPTREVLDCFGIAWTEKLVVATGAGSFVPGEAKALIVASPDAALPDALTVAVVLPVIRVPVPSVGRTGLDLLYDPATADLPGGGGAFATVAIGEAGARNAALLVVSILGLTDPPLWEKWLAFRQRQTDSVLGSPPLSLS